MTRWHRPGTAARTAAFQLPGIRRWIGIAAAAMWTVPTTIFIEEQATKGVWPAIWSSNAFSWGFWGTFGLTCGWLLLGLLANRWRRRNGSFFFISAVVPGFDRDISRWRRAIGANQPGGHPFTDIDSIDGAQAIEEGRSAGTANTFDASAAANHLARDFHYAARRENAATPTNLLLNASWPIGLALGTRLQARAARLWFMRLSPYHSSDEWERRYESRNPFSHRWLNGDLIDVIHLVDLAESPAGDAPDPGRVDQPDLAEDDGAVAVHLQLSGEISGEADHHERFSVTTTWTVWPPASLDRTHTPWTYDISHFAPDAALCANVIGDALNTGRPVHIFARLPLPVGVAIGAALRNHLDRSGADREEQELTLHLYLDSKQSYEAWKLIIPSKHKDPSASG